MSNNTINIDIDALTEDFKAHCKIIKLGYEYPGYTGIEKYAIVTDLSYAQIMERYAPVAEHYCPFLLLSKAAGEVIADFKRNEDKFSKRMQKDDCYGFEDGMTERYNIESIDNNVLTHALLYVILLLSQNLFHIYDTAKCNHRSLFLCKVPQTYYLVQKTFHKRHLYP